MKLNIRLIALLLSLVTLLGIFAACTGETEQTLPPEQSTETPETSTEETSAPVTERTVFDLIVNGESQIKIIRPEKLNSDHAQVAAAVKIRNKIEDLTGVRVTMEDDWKKASDKYDDSTVEILVGLNRHDQVAQAINSLNYGDYTIKAVGNKIVIFGYTDNAMSYAATAFLKIVSNYLSEDKKNISIPVEELNIQETHEGSKELSALPTYDGTEFYATYQSNTNCDEIILNDATAENYAAYITKLEAAGYTKYTENDMNGNLFTTLYNSKYTLNVGYYKPYDECRIIMEPFAEETLIGTAADNQYTAVTTSQITMIGCEYQNSDGSYTGNGLSLLMRLADGSFVIVDGAFNNANHANNLVNAIKEQAKEYATGKDIRIAAWFISHPHGDHDGVLKGKTSSFKQFTVERVIACFMTDEERAASHSAYSDNFGATEGSSDDADRQAANALGAKFIVCHVGQKFYLADTTFEILYTVESYGPTTVNALNTSCILVKATTTDPKTGKSSSTMLMGDTTGPAMAICNKMYGKWMSCEVVQVAHHGYTTWGNNDAMALGYTYMAPQIVLWPQGANAFPNYKEKSYNKTLWDDTNKNFQELYVAGWMNSQYTVPLPYSGDPATIIQNKKTQN